MLGTQKLKPAKVLGVAIAAGAIAASAAALVAGRAATTPALPLVLRDESGAFSLAVQVELGRRDTGKFSSMSMGPASLPAPSPCGIRDRKMSTCKARRQVVFGRSRAGPGLPPKSGWRA